MATILFGALTGRIISNLEAGTISSGKAGTISRAKAGTTTRVRRTSFHGGHIARTGRPSKQSMGCLRMLGMKTNGAATTISRGTMRTPEANSGSAWVKDWMSVFSSNCD